MDTNDTAKLGTPPPTSYNVYCARQDSGHVKGSVTTGKRPRADNDTKRSPYAYSFRELFDQNEEGDGAHDVPEVSRDESDHGPRGYLSGVWARMEARFDADCEGGAAGIRRELARNIYYRGSLRARPDSARYIASNLQMEALLRAQLAACAS